MEAELSTFVVSWNDAAEIQLCVPNDARVIPCSMGVAVAALALRNSTIFLSLRFNNEITSAGVMARPKSFQIGPSGAKTLPARKIFAWKFVRYSSIARG